MKSCKGSVNEPITIIQETGNIIACESSDIDFMVNALGSNPISYQWFDVNGEMSGITNDTISITDINTADAGYYYCELTNTCGTVQSSYKTLSVNENPIIDLGLVGSFLFLYNLT